MTANAQKQTGKKVVHVATFYAADIVGSTRKTARLEAYNPDGSAFDLRCIAVPYGTMANASRITDSGGSIHVFGPKAKMLDMVRDALVAQGFEVVMNSNPNAPKKK